MKEQEEKKKGNLWLTVATFIVNKRKAIEILFVLAIIYSVLCINKVSRRRSIWASTCALAAARSAAADAPAPALCPMRLKR